MMWDRLLAWDALDTALAGTAAACAMACAVPGTFLMLRRQSMMADALSHTALPGIVAAFLLAHGLKDAGLMGEERFDPILYAMLFAGAVLTGVLTATLSEAVRRWGRVESGAALGVVYTSLFAVGLFLLRWKADAVHIEPDAVLFGEVEQAILDVAFTAGGFEVPRSLVVGAGVLLLNLILVTLCWKPLLVSTFDPGLASAVGVNPRRVNDALMAATAVTLVAVFREVGSILVVAMLVTPAAAARCCTDRLAGVLAGAVAGAGASAFVGHALSVAAVPAACAAVGLEGISDAGVAGLTAVSAGVIFVGCALFGPSQGVVVNRLRART